MKICFVLPRSTSRAVGGYKIVFEYANRLASLGHETIILYTNSKYFKRFHVPFFWRKVIFDVLTKIEPKWFPLDNNVKKISDMDSRKVEYAFDADIAIATAASTTEFVHAHFKTPQKVYFIQGYEVWGRSSDFVNSTYALGMKNIVVSKWLKAKVEPYSKIAPILIQNPLDHSVYKEKIPILERQKHSLGVLYNSNPCKGFEYAFQAIEQLKQIYPDLDVVAFGAEKKPRYFPAYIRYIRNATQKETVEIYNSVRTFICASVEEGFGLTGYESMACGCVLVSSDFEGAKEYAINGYNSILTPVGNVQKMVEGVCQSFEDDDYAEILSNNGKQTALENTWDKATKALLEVFLDTKELPK